MEGCDCRGILVVLLFGLLVGCRPGVIEDPGRDPNRAGQDPDAPPPGETPPSGTPDPDPSPPGPPTAEVDLVPDLAASVQSSQVQRLPNRVLVNGLRDWYTSWGLTPPDVSAGLTAPEKVRGWENNGFALTLDPRLIEAWFGAIESTAPAVVQRLVGDCDDAESAACTQQILARAGRLALRRTLPRAELEPFLALAPAASTTLDEDRATALTALLVSPGVFYRVEPNDTANRRPATSIELASRLAAYLWASTPDEALLDAAEQGDLTDPAHRDATIGWMLQDPRARDGMAWFFEQWLELDAIFRAEKSADRYPQWRDDFPVVMRREMATLLEHLVWSDGAGRYADLFTTDLVLPADGLGQLYGIPDGDALTSAANRAGILTRGGFLAREGFEQTSPVLRGHWVREHLLCDLVPEAPANVDNVPPPIEPGATTRERIAARTSGSCAGCHLLMNDIGYAFEGFDADGRARTVDNERPVDASGQAVASDLPPFSGAVQLQAELTTSRMGPVCFVRQMFRYGVGRLESAPDRTDLDRLMSVFDDSAGSIRAVFSAIATTDAFLHVEPLQ